MRVAFPLRTSKVRARHTTLKGLEVSILMITSGSRVLEFMDAYIEFRIFAQWEAPSWIPAVWMKLLYAEVNM